MYADDDDADRARQRGHLTARQAARLAADAGVRDLWLTHFSPSVEDLADISVVARQEFPNAITGVPGLRATLQFDDE
jgi:ribonuclease Z